MKLIGYGEDALTLRSLTERLPEILTQLDDGSDPDSVLILFRPSFGRRSGTEDRRAAAFGEFDAILATDQAVYLVEAKWSRSGEAYKKETIELRREQLRRHDVLRWYLQRWRQLAPTSWEAFRTAVCDEFERDFRELTVPLHDQHLGANLQYVLQHLAGRGEQIVDVLLYVDADPGAFTAPGLPEGSTFRLVEIRFDDVDRTGFFHLK